MTTKGEEDETQERGLQLAVEVLTNAIHDLDWHDDLIRELMEGSTDLRLNFMYSLVGVAAGLAGALADFLNEPVENLIQTIATTTNGDSTD